MSNPESFIAEVTEEVRKDRLYSLFRRYGWIGIMAVLVIVGGAGYREWSISQEQAAAEALGDSLIAALEERESGTAVARLREIEASEGDNGAIVNLALATKLAETGDLPGANSHYRHVLLDPEISTVYRDLAALKELGTRWTELDPNELIEQLDRIDGSGSPFRLLAAEMKAHAMLELGQTEDALEILQEIVEDFGVPSAMSVRVQQLILALESL